MIKTLRILYVLTVVLLLPAAAAAQQTTRYYVTKDATTPAEAGVPSSWDAPVTFESALDAARSGDEIWVKGYDEPGPGHVYRATDAAGFTLKAGVRLYGGFKGGETSADQREVVDGKAYRMRYRTVVSGDVVADDEKDDTNLIFPANTSRGDNAKHVITLTAGGNTLVDGVTIARGHADGQDGTDGQGGGICVTGTGSYTIRRCFFIENYALQGGGLYVQAGVSGGLVDRCGFFNNAAGGRSGMENAGGAVWMAGPGTIVNTAIFNNENGGVRLDDAGAQIVNSTVVRNTGSGVDGNAGTMVWNTVVWGNSLLSTDDSAKPAFRHCAYPEANPGGGPDGDGNIYLAAKNNEPDGPHFDSPSIRVGFDRDFDISTMLYPLWTWMPLEHSNLIDKGDDDAYNDNGGYGAADLDGNTRIRNTIDIGAFEFQPVNPSRIRYVKPDGTGDGTSWANPSGDLQRMIDELAEGGNGQPGEVWVAAGTYEPQAQLVTGTSYSASFRMRDGVSVYGGFAGGETSKAGRSMSGGMPWQFANETVLQAAYYSEDNLQFANDKWTLTSDSRHVVWFAPFGGEGFTRPTYLDGVTIRGGYAQGGTGLGDFMTDRGAGVYIDSEYAYLSNCVVKENYATGNGGGVYLKDGRVQGSLVYNNNSDADGGAVYVDNQGLVHRSMLANNSARNGAGAYLDNTLTDDDGGGRDYPEYLMLSTCVVSNNTATGNGAVYCDGGGVLLQNTITNNVCVTATDLTDPDASQTGGVYVNGYALVANSVVWNNHMNASSSSPDIPMYAKNPSAGKVRFTYNAISGVNNAVWNNILQEQTLALVGENRGAPDNPNSIGPRFGVGGQMGSDADLQTKIGVQGGWSGIDYFWKPVGGSNLWARGMAIGQLPEEVVLAPEIDIEGGLFAQKPAVGAFHVDRSDIVPELSGNTLIVYVDAGCTEPEHDGSSWAKAYRSLNDAVSFFAGLTKEGGSIPVSGDKSELQLSDLDEFSFEIRVLEGDLWPRYAFVNDDPKTATLDILAMQSGKPLKIVGGYYRNNGSNDDVPRDWLNRRSQLNGNPDGDDIGDGLYHVVTVEPGAEVELDGFHIINGYAAGTASLQYGAGMLVRDGADVTLTNCIFENNTAADGAAVDARNAMLTMKNCVVNNNTNKTSTNSVINARSLDLQHVTIVNNEGAAPEGMGASSFAAGNTADNSDGFDGLATTGEAGARNFANPTKAKGATLGFDTYLGGYSSFRPLTSSAVSAGLIINKAATSTDLGNDIMGNERDLGGVPDLGAYEADLPRAGMVLYVRDYGGSDLSKDGRDGSSWDKAINGRANYGRNDGIENDDIGQNNVYTDENIYYITGLQYAVNQAYLKMVKRNVDGTIDYQKANVPANKSGGSKSVTYPVLDEKYRNDGEDNDKRIQVWVGAGEYTSNAGLFMRDGVDVYGGFPSNGNPGMNDRNPRAVANETILKAGMQGPELRGDGDGNNSMPYFDLNENYSNANVTRRVLTQPLPYFDFGRNGLDVERTNIEVTGFKATTTWNGFTITGGNTRINHQREGGAGVALRQNGILEDCVIKNNINTVSFSGRGGGIFCNGGTLINCRIEENELKRGNVNNGRAIFGGGIYLRYGTTYNCVYVKNKLEEINRNSGCELGSAIYIERGNFFNNTVTGNEGCIALGVGKYFQESQLNLINCIIWGNNHPEFKSDNGVISANSVQIGRINQSGYAPLTITNCCIPSESIRNVADSNGTYVYSTSENNQANLNVDNRITNPPLFVDADNYELAASSPCINAGKSDDLTNEGEPVTLPSTDMNYTARIKDCMVDIGAYERDNEDTTEPDVNGVYYVTYTGLGNASANSPENAACAEKLQTVLNAAGERVKAGEKAIIKIAGYENADFVYHANTLADNNDPQSYTFVVPDGVTLEGGYDEDFKNRDAMAYRTVLSAEAVPTQGSTITQNVTGYHAVTFGSWPGTSDLEKGAAVDGVWLVDGSATSMSGEGNPATMGGGAIVPKGAHVRNCVVTGNSAVEGGGLYLLPGGTVSGTAVLQNTADEGGGIYADNGGTENGTADGRAHVISCTIADNTADDGGGLYLEDGASMQVNTVVWGNSAPSNKNVSGVTNRQFADDRLVRVFNIGQSDFYPFNDCFVESQEMPADFENAALESDASLYFADEYRRLKELSLLIKHGVKDDYYEGLQSVFGVSADDMQGRVRVENTGAERVDAGAFAFPGGILPTDLFTRIFVSPKVNIKLDGDDGMIEYLGKSFYTSFSTLEDALAYIRTIRSDNSVGGDKSHFDILMAGGIYKPTYMREVGNNDGSTIRPHNQRLYSFEIPAGVSIYGGFSGTENYAAAELKEDFIPAVDGEMPVDKDISMEQILLARNKISYFSDFNKNNILEPWELANQTILSGDINVSADAHNAYHVLYTDKDKAYNTGVDGGVMLDGLTVMDGETWNVLSKVENENEIGRGGGLYSNAVPYTVNRCRFMNNFGVRGGAVFIRDARLNVISSIFAGNGSMKDASTEIEIQEPRGGALFISENESVAELYAVNSLFVNNETSGEGGAIGTNFGEGVVTVGDPMLSLMNCTFAMNKAAKNAVIYNHNGKSQITNTLMWGNKSESYDDVTNVAEMVVSHSASDYDYGGKFGTNKVVGSSSDDGSQNILLSTSNTDTYGPHFMNPSDEPGVAGNAAMNLWNPAAISIVTDKGDGVVNKGQTEAEGAYKDWFVAPLDIYVNQYMGDVYNRYSGPLDEVTGQTGDRPIDIGLYEYQYVSNFQTMEKIYVATEESGSGSGSDWANATSDLRGAIVGASHPKDRDYPRTVYVRDGEYSLDRLSAGSAFILNMIDDPNLNNSNVLTIKGSCTGVGDVQDFSNSTIIRNSAVAGKTNELLNIITNEGKTVNLEGFTFINTGGTGVDASTGTDGSFTLKNSAFRCNGGSGLNVSGNGGSMLIYNTLFADGDGAGLSTDDDVNADGITLVNTTFANNGTDMSVRLANVYNSVSWNNGTANMPAAVESNNKVFVFKDGNITVDDMTQTPEENNADIQHGPNFVDPLNADKEARNYHIRPSLTLLNNGSNVNYAHKVLELEDVSIPPTEVDLGNGTRLVDGTIDVGAYEYEAPLQPIVYVKAGVVGDNKDGKSWQTALDDLQGAADLVGIYASQHGGENGYVFVHRNVRDRDLRLSLGSTKVYGGMYDETTAYKVYGDDGSVNEEEGIIGKAVGELLDKRAGLVEYASANRSTLTDVNITGLNSVVDGFEVGGMAYVGSGGCLSTSVVGKGASVSGDGLLYNALVYGGVDDGVRAVNVTSTGTLGNVAGGSANNRHPVAETDVKNKYVADGEWAYQLNEDDTQNLDVADGNSARKAATEACISLVGHSRDIAGNLRIRNTVDNGCFETWNITAGMTAGNVVSDADYPHGKSVVYVRKGTGGGSGNNGISEGAELPVTKAYTHDSPFNPGVLLLEHRAGLRGNGNAVGLSHVIMERDVPAGKADMAYVPFDAAATTVEPPGGVALKYYDGNKRAAYDYAFDANDGGAWTDATGFGGLSLLIDNTAGGTDAVVRFVGKTDQAGAYAYEENGGKSVALNVYNNNAPWTSPGGGNTFTHKENMSWNLFGSPYLCAMDYADMEYGRVIYGYVGGGYKTINTDGATEGHVPAGDAVFTQTASLKDAERFGVSLRKDGTKSGAAYAADEAGLALAVARTGGTRDDGACADVLLLNAVAPGDARADFDISADGVKWMADGLPQIYAVRGGGRYSLLSAVNVEGVVAVGVTVPEAGMYTISVPDGCDAWKYDAVILEDAATGRTVDLLEGGYDFVADAPGDVAGRFTVSFSRTAGYSRGVSAYFVSDNVVRVEGVEPGERIRVYSVDGMLVASVVARNAVEDVTAAVASVAVVKVGEKTVVKVGRL